MLPATSTSLLIVTLTPGTTAPCGSVALARMLPVCTWAAAGAATAIPTQNARYLKVRIIPVLLKPIICFIATRSHLIAKREQLHGSARHARPFRRLYHSHRIGRYS